MHISEGVLPPIYLISGWLVSGGAVLFSLKALSGREIPRVALLSGLFFVISLIHIPLGPTSVHLTLNGLLGILLGQAVFPAIFVALFFQALFFQYGGISVLGINTLTMALPPYLFFLLFSRYLQKGKHTLLIGFLSGFLSLLSSGLLMALILYFSNPKLYLLSGIFAGTYLPLSLAEGIITAFAVLYLKRTHPEVIRCCQ
ncbi:cobalamin biosynthesis protein CbiM [Caldimicrobium thiodismutans]|uniref:Cobalamin biosynthesis protein CbiM n=1 Tax=Caldimicrobium thiodismutans TaxID=1653476 RepID=A0A0U4W1V3_9BACT|nr:cobalt transporter CbiM [Caldimicrobium thiodismutans]BAU23069.1 cobalamin biosynthesis protein CbiM [Caldimicrobium thiodismutans]